MSLLSQNSKGSANVLLYQLVYKTKWVFMCVLFLSFSILFQPLDFVFAAEEEAAVEEISSEPEVEEAVEDIEEVVEESESAESDEAIEEELSESTEGDSGIESEVVIGVSDGATQVDSEDTEFDLENENTSEDEATEEDDTDFNESTGIVKATGTPTNTVSTTTGIEVDDSADNSSSTPTDNQTATTTPSQSGSGGSGSSDDESLEEIASTTEAVVSASTTPEIATSTSETENVLEDVEADPVVTVDIEEEQVVDEVVDAEEGNGLEDDTEAEVDLSASTTENVPAPLVFATVNNTANKYQFATNECVNVGDGSFYCSKQGWSTETLQRDQVVARKDAEGDREIYITVEGKELQVTDNQFDDLAPEYDEQSDSVVWHSLRGGRYQIIQYQFGTQEEMLLTEYKTNSMEPSIEGEYVAWQYWDGNDWEIMMFDGSTTTLLTDNDQHDLSPSVHELSIVWTTSLGDGQQAATVYDIESGEMTVIEDDRGGTVQNPRYVLVYDTKYDNGDIVTKGFDPETGIVLSLGATPVELPDELPDSDSTGETRALLQQKSGKEDSAESLLEPQSDPNDNRVVYDDNGTEPVSVASSTNSVELENPEPAIEPLVIPVVTEDGTIDLKATSTSFIELTEYDVPVAPFDAATSSQVGNSTSTDNLVE